jgi:hypothetical protein
MSVRTKIIRTRQGSTMSPPAIGADHILGHPRITYMATEQYCLAYRSLEHMVILLQHIRLNPI